MTGTASRLLELLSLLQARRDWPGPSTSWSGAWPRVLQARTSTRGLDVTPQELVRVASRDVV